MSDFSLVLGGAPATVIIMEPGTGMVERHAVAELQATLAAMTGAELPVVESPSTGFAGIYVGRKEALRAPFDWASLGEDGCLLRTEEDRLILCGNTPRGTLYAVYELLDQQFGCRWLTDDAAHIPRHRDLVLHDLAVAHRPPFRYREPYFKVNQTADWAARNRVNGSHAPLLDQHGGKYSYLGFVHTFYSLVPPAEFFDTHPEYFSEINGQRQAEHAQLCLTNPALIALVTERLRARLRAAPETRIASLSQNDWHGACTCPTCKALDAAEGSHAATMISFVNAVAERLEAEFPQVLFDTLAYTYTVDPPRTVRPRRNVIIRLCQIMACDAHPLDACPRNAKFQSYLAAWPKLAPEVFVWTYANNFHHYYMPYPNLDSIVADIPSYARGGVTGLFYQGDASPDKGPGDMAELRAWLCARLMWRPAQDGWALIREFCGLYYGAAAPQILAWLEQLHAPMRSGQYHLGLYELFNYPLYTEEFQARGRALFAAAEAAVAHDATLLERVRTAGMPLSYLYWRPRLRFGFQKADQWYGPTDAALAATVEDFVARAQRHHGEGLREGGAPITETTAQLAGFPVTALAADDWRLLVVPGLGGRALSWRDARSGVEWCHAGHPHDPDYPITGGYEEYTGPQWRRPGWRGEFSVAHEDGGLTLSRALENDWDLTRAFVPLAAPERGLRVRSTLRNRAARRQELQLRGHPEWQVNDWGTARLRVRRADGTWHSLTPWATAATGDLWLAGQDCPAVAWELWRGPHGLRLSYANPLEKALIGWDRQAGVLRLECFAQAIWVAPGESWSFEQCWTLLG